MGCLARENRGNFIAVYTARVRITVQADGATVIREGHGTGQGHGASPGDVHDIALKAAETDATKRALATFGKPFGLALYGSGKVASSQKATAVASAPASVSAYPNNRPQKRKNDTHASASDPDSRLYRKAAGREAKLSYMGHAVMENRHGLAVAGMVTHANGTAERRASERMLKTKAMQAGRRITAGADKAYDTADHVANLRAINVTPHVTQNNGATKTGKNRRSAIDERTTRHDGYGMSQSRRAMIECIFGLGKQHGTMRKTKHRGIGRVAADFMLNLIAYNLIRIPKLVAA
jgi:recombination DNA repair RAD52 pathway protein